MDESEVGGRIERLEEVLDQLERTPGATAAAAIEAVALVASVYGEALARMTAAAGPVAAAWAGDELVGHLMALHGVHPLSVEQRVDRALDEVRPYARSHGGDIELVAVGTGVATVKLSGSCDGCSASQATLEGMVRDAVLGTVPELAAVEAMPATATAHPAPAPAPAAVPVAFGARGGSAVTAASSP